MGEDRLQIWNDYIDQGGQDHETVRHMFVDYSRYHEARLIAEWFDDRKIDLNSIKILDYGAGVGDYGIYLIDRGADKIDMYDFPRSTGFIQYRLNTKNLSGGRIINADDTRVRLDKYDLIIFGEVLEHLQDPASILNKLIRFKTKYIFTSSYPYRSDDPNDPYWNNHDHDDNARLQMPLCRSLLEDNYNYTKFDGELRLWTRK